MRTVVVGANGFLGRTLTTRLLAEGHEVVAVIRRGRDRVPAGVRMEVISEQKGGEFCRDLMEELAFRCIRSRFSCIIPCTSSTVISANTRRSPYIAVEGFLAS